MDDFKHTHTTGQGSIVESREMLIRIDEKLSSLTLLVSTHNDRNAKEFKELWEELESYKTKVDSLALIAVENSFSARVGRSILFLAASAGLGVLFNKIL